MRLGSKREEERRVGGEYQHSQVKRVEFDDVDVERRGKKAGGRKILKKKGMGVCECVMIKTTRGAAKPTSGRNL